MNPNIANSKIRVRRQDLLEPDLSYKIVGVLFRVYNELGPGLHEKYYQKAVAIGFDNENVNYREQVYIPLKFDGKFIGKYYADFIIEEKIVLELKTGNQINRMHAKQILAYLQTTNMKLGILAYFGKDGVFFKRIINDIRNS